MVHKRGRRLHPAFYCFDLHVVAPFRGPRRSKGPCVVINASSRHMTLQLILRAESTHAVIKEVNSILQVRIETRSLVWNGGSLRNKEDDVCCSFNTDFRSYMSDVMKQIIQSLTLCHLDYCPVIWSSASKKGINETAVCTKQSSRTAFTLTAILKIIIHHHLPSR